MSACSRPGAGWKARWWRNFLSASTYTGLRYPTRGERLTPRPKHPVKHLLDAFGAAHRLYNAENDTLFVVRPDGYLGYRSHPADAEKAAAWLHQILR